MKTPVWIKKALHIYLLNFVLIVGQITAIGAPVTSYATSPERPTPKKSEPFYPPGFSITDYRTVAQRDEEARRNLEREESALAISNSICRTVAASAERRMQDVTVYRAVTGAQGYNEICLNRQRLNELTGGPVIACGASLELIGDSANIATTGSLQTATARYGTTPGGSISHIDDEEWKRKREAVIKRLDTSKSELERLTPLVPGKRAAYRAAADRCSGDRIYCTPEELNNLQRLRTEYVSVARQHASAVVERQRAQQAYDQYGRDLMPDAGSMATAGASTLSNEANMVQSDTLSGISTNGSALSGPVYDANEALKASIERYTSNAAIFAEEKIAEAGRLELLNANEEQYQLYDLALSGIDETSRGGRMALSNLDVMAMASASIKKLECNPIAAHDSKAYHIFRAASATYVSALLSDQSSHSSRLNCMRDEEMDPNAGNDTQFETVQRALNAHTQIVDTMCMNVDPDPDNIPADSTLSREQVLRLKQICDASAGPTCTTSSTALTVPPVGTATAACAPRTKETALEMYNTALMIAHQELSDKRQLVATAEANVKKGEKKVKATITNIAIAAALDTLHKVLKDTFKSIGTAKNASHCRCGAPDIAKSKFHMAKKIFWYGKYVYFVAELIRWKAFVKKWKRKLAEARVHTHLACNSGDAVSAETASVQFAQKLGREAAEARAATEREIQKALEDSGLNPLNRNTSFLKLPEGLNRKSETHIVNLYLKNYINLFGKTALNMIFPDAFAEDTVITSDDSTNGLTQTATSARALGMAIGSSSFHQFIISQNKHWQDQAYDASAHSSESGYILTNNPILYCDSSSDTGCIKNDINPDVPGDQAVVGMPTPETRVRLLTDIVGLVTENINGHLDELATNVDHRDRYVTLLETMRDRMPVGDQGLAPQVQEGPGKRSPSCMTRSASGMFEIDKTCQCQRTGNCASLRYASIGEFKFPELMSSEANIKNYTNKLLSGKLKAANMEAGKLSSNSNAIRRRIEDSFSKANELREKSGKKSIDYKKKSRERISGRRNAAFNKYKKTFPMDYKKQKLTLGGLGSFSKDFYNATGKGRGGSAGEYSNQKGSSLDPNGKVNFGGLAALGKGSDGSYDSDDSKLSLDDLDEGDYGSRSSNGYRNNSHSLSKLNKKIAPQSKDDKSKFLLKEKNQINKNSKSSLFSIISKRYEKSAFPVFLTDQSMR